jgi:hypothetical protein
MVEKLSELRKLSKSELEKRYDKEAENVQSHLIYYHYEIRRREQSKQTTWLIILTLLVFIATVISAIGVFVK